MNSIWNKNLELFYSRFPDLYNLLNDFFSIKTFDLSNKQMCDLILNSFKAAFIENDEIKTKLINQAEMKMKELLLL